MKPNVDLTLNRDFGDSSSSNNFWLRKLSDMKPKEKILKLNPIQNAELPNDSWTKKILISNNEKVEFLNPDNPNVKKYVKDFRLDKILLFEGNGFIRKHFMQIKLEEQDLTTRRIPWT